MPQHLLKDLVNDNILILNVMSRFGISLGFADKSVETVCREHEVDCDTFLAVANFISNRDCHGRIDLESLMNYLKKAHNYFLDFNIPTIKRKLIEALDCSTKSSELALLTIKFYDEYALEVRKHMLYENNTVFPYVSGLLSGILCTDYNIGVFQAQHNHIDSKLKELKDIIIRYYPQKENDLLNAVLFDIMNCEYDLISHCAVEDQLFVPEVQKMERKIQNSAEPTYSNTLPACDLADSPKLDMLSEREREIVCCIAKGMSYKGIADHLCLSIHTVNTHRRNIYNKLEIRSAAGLTIFAIINKLVKVDEIKHLG